MADILTYFGMAFTGINLLLALLGTVIGIVIGALPGFTPTMGIAVLIPVTYTLEPTAGLVFWAHCTAVLCLEARSRRFLSIRREPRRPLRQRWMVIR